MPLYNKALLLSSYALTINMVNRILSGIYIGFAFFLLAVVLSSNAKAVDVDLVPINFTFNPEYPIDGEAIEISFEVINNGNEPANEVKIIVWNSTVECDSDDECVPVFESTEAVIDQSKIATIEFTCKPDGIDGCGGIGDHVLTIFVDYEDDILETCLLYTSPSPRDGLLSRMPSSA